MKRINKVDSRLLRTAYGWPALLMSLPFVGIGIFFALAGFGLTPLPGKANAPLWIIGSVGLMFAFAGLLLLFHSLRGLWYRQRRERLFPSQAHRSWLSDYPWDPAGIRDNAHTRWLNALIGTLLLGVFMVPFNWWAFVSDAGGLFVQIITGVFDLVLLLVFLSFVYRLLQFLKYGRSELTFAHFPFTPGEPLKVVFHARHAGPIKATLRYVEERFEQRGHGRDRNVSHQSYEHYSEARTFAPDARSTGIPVEFQLPEDNDWVNQLTADDQTVRYWELLLQSDEPGIDFRTTFPVPVYNRSRGQVTVVPKPVRRRRFALRVPYAFEIGLPLGLLSLLALTWYLAPDTVRKTVHTARSSWAELQAIWELKPVEDVGSSAMAVSVAPDGRVWVLTKYELQRFDGETMQTLLDRKRYRKLFEHKVNALSSLLVTGADEAWLGSWYGELFHYRQGAWRQLSRRGQPLQGRIHGLAIQDDRVYLATAEGLWTWDANGDYPYPVDRVPKGAAEDIAVSAAGDLCAGIRRELWCLRDAAWTSRWQAPSPITALYPMGGEQWLLGTRNGFHRWTAGDTTDPELPGKQVTGFARDGDLLWVSTWNGGLYRHGNGGWSSHQLKNLSGFAVAPDNTFWMAVYGEGLIRTSTGYMERLLHYRDFSPSVRGGSPARSVGGRRQQAQDSFINRKDRHTNRQN